ncbi:DJ-1/PfpI family protein [Nonomuraea sp. NBC_01738]|uniref:DJ-1/PfpI family protein n=1 Tax=Nonomuraea sp. NBC_01738 TaxID=2976003 RepID=UPI002E0FA190|nr:DJ-1/PfpI family protein [Nonomuraea sp. NBC_01738]
MKRIVHVGLYDTFADWEVGHATAHLRNGYWHQDSGDSEGFEIVYVGRTLDPVTSIGGLRALPDITLDQLSPEESAMLILPGAELWETGGLDDFGRKAAEFITAGVPVAAICGAVVGLAAQGQLNGRPHTGNVKFFLEQQEGYTGGDLYVEADAVTGDKVITAGGTDPEAFAREIFATLDVYKPDVLDAWFRLFHDSDPSAFEVLSTA